METAISFDKRNDGKASVGWLTRPSGVFCFNANGIRYENTQLISTSGKIYIIGSDGKRCSGWTNYRGERYYINNRGYAHTGWLRRGGKWYCFDKKERSHVQKPHCENGSRPDQL